MRQPLYTAYRRGNTRGPQPRAGREALFPLWFLAIAGTANGVAHPLMAAYTGAYSPGLATSPVVGVLGLLLLRRLALLTQPDSR